MHNEKGHIRDELIRKLNNNRVFWSYKEQNRNLIDDDLLIEKILVYYDIDDIEKLFLLYPESKVKQVWDEKLIPDDRYHTMNLLFAYLYFNIKNPEKYLKRKLKQHYKKLVIS